MDSEAQLDLLKLVWSHSPGRYVSLPTFRKDGGSWYNGDLFDKDHVKTLLIRNIPGLDLYFSPLTYDGATRGRRRSNISEAGVIFADMDGAPELTGLNNLPPPNLVVASGSVGHEHWYWFLNEPVPIEEWELYARGTSEQLGADPGGWDSTQVLRIPGSLNHKHSPATEVQVLSQARGSFPITAFPKTEAQPVVYDETALPPLPKVNLESYKLAQEWAWPLLTVEDKLLLAGREKARDRSKVIWRMIREWRDQLGFSEATIFLLLVRAPFQKYPPEKLWAQIHK